MPTLDVHDQAVLWSLYRLARGWGKDTCTISNETLAKRANCSERQVQTSTARLNKTGLIKKLTPDFSNQDKRLRGNVYQVNLPAAQYTSGARGARGAQPASGARPAYNKEKAFKEKIVKEAPSQIDPTKHSAVLALMNANSELTYAAALAAVEGEGK